MNSWSYGRNWPNDGEIDAFEGWNDASYGKQTFHTGSSAIYGECTLDQDIQTDVIESDTCDNTYSDLCQTQNQGCASNDFDGPWASPEGGICKFSCFVC